MKKSCNMKQRLTAAILAVVLLAMSVPSSTPLYAASENEESLSETGGNDMLHAIPDNGIYPDSLNLYRFDSDAADFSCSAGDNMNIAYQELWPAGSRIGTTMYSVGFTTTVDSLDGFTRTGNPICVTQKNVCKIGDRSVDLSICITKITVGKYRGIPWGDYGVGSTIMVGGVWADDLNADSPNIGAFNFSTDYGGAVEFDWEANMTWSDTGETVDVPCEVIANDIDMGPNSGNGYTEAWTFYDPDYSRYDLYEDNILDISHPDAQHTTFSAVDYDGPGNTPKEEYAYTGVVAISNNGKFSGTAICSSLTGSFLSFWCDYVAPFNDPEPDKTIDDPQSSYNAGDVIPYTCTMRMPEYMVDTYGTYSSIAFVDEIHEGLHYVDGSAGVFSDGTDITDSAGTFSYTDNGDGTETVRFDFYESWVQDTDHYNGQELQLKLSCAVEEGYNGETVRNDFIPIVDDITYTATAYALVTDPALALTKTADRTVYSLGDTVTYTMSLEQTTPEAVARNTVVTDTLPDELELIDVTTSLGTAQKEGNAITVDVGDLWDEDTATITVTATAVEAAEEIENIAYAGADYVTEVNDRAIVTVQAPVLNIEKSADREQYNPGDTVTYSLCVRNTEDETADGEDPVPTAYNVVVSDTLPEGLTLLEVKDDAEGEVETDGNSLTVFYPYMNRGQENRITVTATVNDDLESTTLTNMATVQSDYTEPVDDEVDIEVIKPILASDNPTKNSDTINEERSDPVNADSPRTGQDVTGIVAAVVVAAAAAMIVIVLWRRRKIK